MEVQQQAVHSDLEMFLPRLRNSIESAVAAYNGDYSAAQHRLHSKRSTASVIHDHIVHNMAALAETADGVELTWSKNLWMLQFRAGYLIRFKKVGSSKIAAGHRTRQVKKYRNQQQLENLPPSVNLDLGYELDKESKLAAVYLICPSGTWSNMWESELLDTGALPVVVSLFGTPPKDPEGAKLLPKKRDKKYETQSGDDDSCA